MYSYKVLYILGMVLLVDLEALLDQRARLTLVGRDRPFRLGVLQGQVGLSLLVVLWGLLFLGFLEVLVGLLFLGFLEAPVFL